jgi:hypothetical protein
VDVPGRLAETSRFDTLTYRWHEPPYDLVIDMRRASRGLCNIVVDPWCRKNLYKTEKARGEQMFASMTEYLGQPWMVLEKGTVRTPKGTFMYSGTDRFKGEFKAEPGQRFAVHPADGLLAWIPDGGEKQGPYRAFGNNCSHPPAGLRYDGPECDAEGGVELTDADRAALEALGYLQPEAEEAEGSEAPPG